MNVLILTGYFGMGHYSVAEALKQEIQLLHKDSNIEIVDIIQYIFPTHDKVIYSAFNMLVTRWSNVYNFFYKYSDKFSINISKSFYMKKLDKLFLNNNPDIVICTLPLSAKYISKYKTIRGLDIPLLTCITDIFCHKEWINKNTDCYLVGAKEVRENLVNKGVEEEKIYVTGIPVKEMFKKM